LPFNYVDQGDYL